MHRLFNFLASIRPLIRLTYRPLAIVSIISTLGIASQPAHAAQGQQNAIGALTASLPPCRLDSFVYQAGVRANDIYGDEGKGGKPPLSSFTKASRINSGITGVDAAGLTTGHGSYLPDATGRDEFIGGSEWDMTGGFASAESSDWNEAPGNAPDSTRTKETAGSGANGFMTLAQMRASSLNSAVTHLVNSDPTKLGALLGF
jgi:hypothetical protein